MSAYHGSNSQSQSNERAELLVPGILDLTSHREQHQQQQLHHHQFGRTRSQSRSPARHNPHLERPFSLLIVASVDLLTTFLFTFILDIHSRDPHNNRTIRDHTRPNPALRLLTLGYVRSLCTLALASRKNWTKRGRLRVLLGFVVTGLEVLWEINTSVLYRGWEGNMGNGRAEKGSHDIMEFSVRDDEGRKRSTFLALQIVFASIEYVTYALSIHYAARTSRQSSNRPIHPEHTGGRRRATSVRFDERGRRNEEDVFGSRSEVRTDRGDFLRPYIQDERVDQNLGESESESDGEGCSDGSTESDASEDDLERSSGSSEEDEDEIIDLPLPEEAKIERKTSIMSLRSRQRASSHPHALCAGVLGDEEQGLGHPPRRRNEGDEEQLDEGRTSVWGSIRGALGWNTTSKRTTRMDGYGTI